MDGPIAIWLKDESILSWCGHEAEKVHSVVLWHPKDQNPIFFGSNLDGMYLDHIREIIIRYSDGKKEQWEIKLINEFECDGYIYDFTHDTTHGINVKVRRVYP